MKVRVRFAPSPTGEIHIGNIRTAIINWLFARRLGGDFVLRIEDTDQVRSDRAFEAIILEEMGWLGLNIDEGVGAKGEYGPYRQMERLALYKKYADYLEAAGMAFPCFCTPAAIEKHREEARAKGQNLLYSGACRNLTAKEVAMRRQEGQPEGLRFRNPGSGEIEFDDLIRGQVSFKVDLLDDFILMKSDGTPTYNFACVIDDYRMKITHVLRGEDHISNTPKQLILYQALQWEPPLFGHLSLILDKSGQKFKKRSEDQEVYVGRYREKGYLAEALFNYISLLGWSPEENREIFSREEAVELFDLERVNPAPAIFDIEKLNWMNSLYIRNLPMEELLELAQPFLIKEGLVLAGKPLQYLLEALQPRVVTLAELAVEAKKSLSPLPVDVFDSKRDILGQEGVAEVLRWFHSRLAAREDLTPEEAGGIIKDSMKELNIKGRLVYKPLRLALTGRDSGPELNEIMAFLGSSESAERIAQTLEFIKKDRVDNE